MFNFLLFAGAVQGFLFIIVPILMKKKIDKPIWYLNGFVLFMSLNNLQAWLIDNGYTSSSFFIKNLELPWYMFVAPFFYDFLIRYLQITQKRKLLVMLSVFIFVSEIIIRIGFIWEGYQSNLNTNLIETYTRIEEVFNALFTIIIFSKSAFILFKHTKLQEYIASYDNIRWIKQFVVFGFIIILFWIFAIVFNLYNPDINSKAVYNPLRLGSSILIYWIGYQGLIRYNLMQDRISLRRRLKDNTIEIKRTKHKLIQENNKHFETFRSIEHYLTKHKKYLDVTYSLSCLAQEMDISVSHLSKLINTYSAYNFSEYINQFRVQYAKQLLIDTQYKAYTIIAIGLESGFNSKSTFYTAFKRFTKQTPVEFRKQHIDPVTK